MNGKKYDAYSQTVSFYPLKIMEVNDSRS